MKDVRYTINISTQTFVKILIFFLLVAFFWLVREAIALIFVALILASALDPFVDWLKKFKIPRGMGIILVYIILFVVITSAVILIIPPIATEVKLIANDFPTYYEKVVNGLNYFTFNRSDLQIVDQIQGGLNSATAGLSKAASGAFNTLLDVFGGIMSFFLVLVITFYFTVEEEGLRRFIKSMTPTQYQPYALQLMTRIQRRLGYWLRGQLILSLIIFVLTFIGLTVLGVEYALLLALIAGIFEIIPYLGPFLGAIPAVFLAFAQSPLKAGLVMILFFVIQQLENNIIVPKVMSKSVGINPLLVIIVLLVGGKMGGVLGMILAVPVATAISVFLEDFLGKKIDATE
ncbi:AI-2E family transporter [Patescibacteria group bacterium]|nr:AI-2E family transporter [Patescibacteria group bacterium]